MRDFNIASALAIVGGSQTCLILYRNDNLRTFLKVYITQDEGGTVAEKFI